MRFFRLVQLDRITSGGEVLPEIEGLRFIAITTVVLFHLTGNVFYRTGYFVTFQQTGRFAVMLFFSISGFILALRFAKQHLRNGATVDLKAYFMRRLTRLEPPFVVNALVLLPMFVMLYGTSVPRLLEGLTSLLYLHQIVYHSAPIINVATWSLELEIQFYVLAPILGLLYKIRPRMARYLALAILMVLAGICNQQCAAVAWYRNSVFFFMHYFLAGFLLADFYVDLWQARKTKTWTWDLASLAGWTTIVLLVYEFGRGSEGVDQTTPWVVIGIVLAYAGALRGRISGALLSFGPVPVIGGMCYTIYLYHYPVIIAVSHLVARCLPGSPFLFTAVAKILVSLPLVGMVSVMIFALVERPCMDRRWPEKLRNRLARGAFPAVSSVKPEQLTAD